MYDMVGYVTELNYDGQIVLFVAYGKEKLIYQGTFDSFEALNQYLEEKEDWGGLVQASPPLSFSPVTRRMFEVPNKNNLSGE